MTPVNTSTSLLYPYVSDLMINSEQLEKPRLICNFLREGDVVTKMLGLQTPLAWGQAGTKAGKG